MTVLTSPGGNVEFGTGHPTLLINDQLWITDENDIVLTELKEGKTDRLLEIAHQGKKLGLDAADILIGHPELDEVELLPKVAVAVCEEVQIPVMLDSRNPDAIEAALQALSPYKACINSVSTEKEMLDKLIPVAVKYNAAIIGMPMGQGTRVPYTVDERVEEAKIILEAAEKYGLPKEDIVMDGLVLASAVEPDSMKITLETLKVFEQEFGLSTILGIGNAGHGMPIPLYIDLAYLLAAIPWGLHAALVHPETPGLIESVRATDFLVNRDPYGRRYISYYRSQKKNKK